MSGLYPLRQQPGDFSRTTLCEEIEAWVAAIEDAAANLPAAGAPITQGLFAYHKNRLTELATQLIDYTLWRRHPYFSIMHQSESTLAAAEAAITRAGKCAELFEEYESEVRKYSQTGTSLELRSLLAQLINLGEWLNCT
jgi:hypothetical protein